MAQMMFHLHALNRLLVHLGSKKPEGITFFSLGLIHRRVGIAQKDRYIVPVIRINCNADTGRDESLPPFKGKWGREKFKDLPCQRNNLLLTFVLEVLKNNKKFVASQAGHRVAFANGRYQPAGGLHQKLIPHWMPQGIINHLKTVKVDIQNRHNLFFAPRPHQGLR